MTEDVHHISNTTDVFRPESVHLSGDSGSKWQTGQPLLRAGQIRYSRQECGISLIGSRTIPTKLRGGPAHYG